MFFLPVTREPSSEQAVSPANNTLIKNPILSLLSRTPSVQGNAHTHTHRSDFAIVVLVREVSCKTEISNLESEILGDEHVTGSQVPVHTLQRQTIICHWAIIVRVCSVCAVCVCAHVILLASAADGPFHEQSAEQSRSYRGQ